MTSSESRASLAPLLFVLLATVGASTFSLAAAQESEVNYLFAAVESSDCTFIRNDISMSSQEFQRHLRSKLRRNDELITSAEEFIDKIGTRSAESGRPYVALCNGELRITREWFTELLMAYRTER